MRKNIPHESATSLSVILHARWRLIAAVFAGTVALAIVVTLVWPPQYKAVRFLGGGSEDGSDRGGGGRCRLLGANARELHQHAIGCDRKRACGTAGGQIAQA